LHEVRASAWQLCGASNKNEGIVKGNFSTILKIQKALEQAGIHFIESASGFMAGRVATSTAPRLASARDSPWGPAHLCQVKF
jgi:hypothetical protein